ncbi:MAG: ribulose-phosphate 3-epimerase [Bacilli bacterium]|nr:ribulose-phosphate 3-epimerase [Bacilli bacterium]
MELSVSILNSQEKKEMINILNKTDISYIHLDVMDGKFVPQKSLSKEEIITLADISEKKLDIHLMVDNPIEYIESIKHLSNIEYITIHLEIDKDIKYILSKIKSYGYKTGLSIKPNTNIDKLIPYLDDLDLILLMTVEPGLGGQPFISSSSNKLKELKKITNENIKLEVDGGINNMTIKNVSEADIAVVGSYITTSNNPIDKINSLLV